MKIQRHKNQVFFPLNFEDYLKNIFESADIKINGSRPWDIQVHDNKFYQEVILKQSLGLGESYMKGYWSCESLDQLFHKIFSSPISKQKLTLPVIILKLQRFFLNHQSLKRSKKVCEEHYDLNTELYKKMLDQNMVYTCAFWEDTDSLEKAQENKLKLVCEKLDLAPGMKVLDIGCGFGSFMKYATTHYGVECVGYSLSKEQIKYGQKNTKGLPITYIYDDYRNIHGQFDRVVSIGMLVAVGSKNYQEYFKVVHRSLKDDGIALIHTIGHNHTTHITDPWVDRYIFPNGHLPSITQVGSAIEELFIMEDWHNFGPHYDLTLMAWNKRFQQSWPELKSDFSETFKRMWEFYLLSFAGGFRARNWQLWQIVLTKKGRKQPSCRNNPQ